MFVASVTPNHVGYIRTPDHVGCIRCTCLGMPVTPTVSVTPDHVRSPSPLHPLHVTVSATVRLITSVTPSHVRYIRYTQSYRLRLIVSVTFVTPSHVRYA